MTNLLKIKGVDGGPSESDEASQLESEQQTEAVEGDETEQSAGAAAAGGTAVNKQDMQRKMSSGLGKLDSLLAKTKNAHNSLAQSNK